MNKPACHACGKTATVKLRRLLNSAGATMIAWRCLSCDCWAENPMHWLRHIEAQDIIGSLYSLDDIPLHVPAASQAPQQKSLFDVQ